MQVLEQTSYYYYYKYNKYNNNNRKKKGCFSLVAMMRCATARALCVCIVMVAVFQNISEHTGTPEHAWWFSLVLCVVVLLPF